MILATGARLIIDGRFSDVSLRFAAFVPKVLKMIDPPAVEGRVFSLRAYHRRFMFFCRLKRDAR